MSDPLQPRRDAWNAARFRPGMSGGLYESYFLRANHPERALAFWIRYTVFCPQGRPQEAQGELWAIWFDGEMQRIVAVKESRPIAECRFSPERLDARIGTATLADGRLEGRAASADHAVSWRLTFAGEEPPLLLLPGSLYAGGFPKAKALVARPNGLFSGTLTVDGREIAIDGWRGSQNHNQGLFTLILSVRTGLSGCRARRGGEDSGHSTASRRNAAMRPERAIPFGLRPEAPAASLRSLSSERPLTASRA